jgi:uncharacterized protein YbcV (DUF1398 family)
MNAHLQQIAATCLAGADSGAMTFPAIIGALLEAGFEGYTVDFRAGTVGYHLPSGETVTLAGHRPAAAASPYFDVDTVVACIREAQAGGSGYTYPGFCERVVRAGCVGYVVSFPGRRVVYLGRTGETQTEHFPPAK